jgi:hypothetical protein
LRATERLKTDDLSQAGFHPAAKPKLKLAAFACLAILNTTIFAHHLTFGKI